VSLGTFSARDGSALRPGLVDLGSALYVYTFGWKHGSGAVHKATVETVK
jgi:hypothetical protein